MNEINNSSVGKTSWANERKRKEEEKSLKELVELAIDILEFRSIEKMSPAEMSRENYFQDKKGKVILGILIGQFPNFQTGSHCEVGDSYQFHGLIKEVFLLRNGRWKIFERKIICFSDGKESQKVFLREELQDQSLDDFELESLCEFLNSRIDEQLILNARREALDSI